jgi:cobyrinic acid a,c-diamide synthase
MNNVTFIHDMIDFTSSNKPILAECAGMLYLLDKLAYMSGQQFSLVGFMPGRRLCSKKLSQLVHSRSTYRHFIKATIPLRI